MEKYKKRWRSALIASAVLLLVILVSILQRRERKVLSQEPRCDSPTFRGRAGAQATLAGFRTLCTMGPSCTKGLKTALSYRSKAAFRFRYDRFCDALFNSGNWVGIPRVG